MIFFVINRYTLHEFGTCNKFLAYEVFGKTVVIYNINVRCARLNELNLNTKKMAYGLSYPEL